MVANPPVGGTQTWCGCGIPLLAGFDEPAEFPHQLNSPKLDSENVENLRVRGGEAASTLLDERDSVDGARTKRTADAGANAATNLDRPPVADPASEVHHHSASRADRCGGDGESRSATGCAEIVERLLLEHRVLQFKQGRSNGCSACDRLLTSALLPSLVRPGLGLGQGQVQEYGTQLRCRGPTVRRKLLEGAQEPTRRDHPGRRRRRRSASWTPGGTLLPRVLQPALLSTPLQLLRRPSARRALAALEHRWLHRHPGGGVGNHGGESWPRPSVERSASSSRGSEPWSESRPEESGLPWQARVPTPRSSRLPVWADHRPDSRNGNPEQ